MRTLALILLLASTATPALAQRSERSAEDRAQARTERAQARAERSENSSRSERTESRSEQRAMRSERQSAPAVQETQSAQQQSAPAAQETQTTRRQAYQSRRERVRQQQTAEQVDVQTTTTAGESITPRQRTIRTIPNTNVATQQQTDGTVTTQHRSRDGSRYSGNHRRWDRNHWRGDRRYDWRRYRSYNRSLFHLGLYTDPFGWNYRRWGIGSYLYPSYYSSSFWLDDPWHYRLPPVYGPYRWVRYHNDAFLVDIFSGQVVDVIYNFFW